MYIDKRMLYVIMAIMIICGLASYLSSTTNLLMLLFSIPGVLIAITFHEFAHAIAADKLGDDTPRMEGRISLNPLSHIDPIGFIMLLFAGFGWGKPVNINSRNYNRDITVEKADAIVSIAGPLMNFALAIIFSIIYFIIFKFGADWVISNQIANIIVTIIIYIIQINVGLGIFNLIPLPPLDGSKVIKPLLTYNAKRWFEDNERIFYIIFIILWLTGIAGKIINPLARGFISIIFKMLAIMFRITI